MKITKIEATLLCLRYGERFFKVSYCLKQRAKPMSKNERDIDFARGLFEPVIGYFRTVTVRQ